MAVACGKLVYGGEGGDVGHVAVGGVALEGWTVGVGGDERAGVGGGEDGGGEDGAGVVDELGVGVGEEEVDAVGEALLDFDLASVVVGLAGVIAVGGDVEEAGEGFEELGVSGVLATDGAGDGELAEVGVRYGGEERVALGELCGGELVEVGVGDADVDDVGANVGDVDGEIFGNGALDGYVPLLDVSGAGGFGGGIDALAEAGVGGEGDWRDAGTFRESEGGIDGVQGLLRDVLDEGELWRGEGSGDAGLVDEDYAEAGA